MEISYLREFVVLAETGNFLEAAQILYISQSTLSKHIKRIESELGVSLFDRTTRKVEINKFGELLLPYARQIAELQERYTDVLRESLANDQESVNLGSIPALAQYNITDILVAFKNGRPQSTINVIQAGSEQLKELLRQRKCDLAFIRDVDNEDEDLVKIPYTTDHLIVILPTTHPLATKTTIPLRALADENFLMIEKGTMPYRISLEACQQNGFEPKITYTDHRLENLFDLVIKGMGVALLLKQLVLHVNNPDIAVVDISPLVSTQINLCHLKGVDLSDAARYFIQCTEPGYHLGP